ncbi:MAG: class 1 fructose-bisphosphatase [Hyphomicrobiaceae bacterium]|nr:class 1 fructose-bisphosphatase [Hyphomicrobiaceae bacterium]
MTCAPTLEGYLSQWSGMDADRLAAAKAVLGIAKAATQIAAIIRRGPLAGHLGAATGGSASGDAQKALDVTANTAVVAALTEAGVAAIASEELDDVLVLDARARVAVAVDPLDGSSNIDTNVSIGTIFSVIPVPTAAAGDAAKAFLQPGRTQLAAGYVIYGPNVAMALTVGEGSLIFTLDPETQAFVQSGSAITIALESREYAINASNYRHWSEATRAYVDDCIAGTDGPRGVDFNMRWIASLVAEAHRILVRGGVFLYPRDARKGYGRGRLRLIYEASPIAFLIEQAGGRAIDGSTRILDLVPAAIHDRAPLIFGSAGEVDRIARYKAEASSLYERSPLFGRRGLLKT